MPRHQVTITVEKKLLEWIDAQIKTARFRNRSHAFEYAVTQLTRREKEKEKPANEKEFMVNLAKDGMLGSEGWEKPTVKRKKGEKGSQ